MRALSKTDIDLAEYWSWKFGEFDELVRRVLAVLRESGFGEIT
jgi:hypothetical protein